MSDMRLNLIILLLLCLLVYSCKIKNSHSGTDDGMYEESCQLVDEKKDGLCKQWYPNGKLRSEVYYSNGLKHGLSVNYHKNGAIWTRCTYKYDTLFGKFQMFHSNKKLNYLTYYDEFGKPDSLHLVYYPNGMVSQMGFYDHGKKIKVWTDFDVNGNLVKITYY